MKDKGIIALLQRQLEVSQATIDGLRKAMNDMQKSFESIVNDFRKTIRSLEQALIDKGIETAKTRKALRNVAALMEKHNERQKPSASGDIDQEFTPKSCRLNGINVMDYLSDILNRCASWNPLTPVQSYRDLLPDRWKPSENA